MSTRQLCQRFRQQLKSQGYGEILLFGQPVMTPATGQRLFLAAVMAVCLVADCYPAATGLADDQSGPIAWILLVMYTCACALLPLMPQWMSIGVIALTAICIPLPWTHLEDLTFGCALAFAALYYCLPTWIGLAVQVAFTAEFAIYHVFWGRGTAFVIIGIILQVASSVIGYTYRRQRLNEQNKRNAELLHQAEASIARTERDLVLARNLHDTLTNDLASISMLCGALLLDCKDPEQRRTLQAIDDTSREAMQCAHHAIDVLRNTGESRTASMPGTWQNSLRELLDRQARHLTACGYHGAATFEHNAEQTPIRQDVYDELASFTIELFANIEHHCPNGGDFSIRYRIEHGRLVIVQTNTAGGDDRHTRSGRGLALHRRIIESMGGELTYATDEDVWMLRAAFVLSPADVPRSRH